ncbi:Pycsar system effector family protein [Alkalihalobacterium sp. APHAB7]|uniref:Pycsar system effector family protein n=1 Tax=Alkalihalobacterium sp. APHAB7 TaxID=3402081 RepID=UPI003AADA601
MIEDKSIDKDDLLFQLDRHLDWIKSCDTKSSIVLAVVGIILSIFTSEHSIKMLNDILSNSVQNISFSNILYLLLFTLSWCVFLYGAYCLIRVLIPRLGKEGQAYDGTTHKDSLYYFEDISKNTFTEYKDKVFNRSNDNEITDILSQIFVNAKICTSKYSYYSKGIKYTSLGITGVVILYIIGIILVKTGGF